MTRPLLIRGARQLVTLRGSPAPRRGAAMRDLGIVDRGSVLIVDGRIAGVGPERHVDRIGAALDADEYDAAGKVVMPGFVDSHTHLVWTRPRLADYEMRIAGATYTEIAEAGGGILSTVEAVRETPEKLLYCDAKRGLDWSVASGTTTIEAKSGYGLDESAELKILRITNAFRNEGYDVVPTFLGAHITPEEFDNAGEYVDWLAEEMIPRVAHASLATFADVFCEAGAFTLAQSKRYLEAARKNGLGLKLHADQFTRSGGAILGVQLGAASVDHLECATAEDIDSVARSGTIATLLPGAVYHLSSGAYAPARMFIDRGAAIALATDFNPGTSPTASMPMILSLACTQLRLTPAEAITAATINGAHALAAAQRIGSLEQGKDGNAAVFDCADYREIPYFFGMHLVEATVVRGRVVYRRGQHGAAAC